MNVLIASNSRLVAEGTKLMVLASFSKLNVIAVESIDNLLGKLDFAKGHHWDVILIDEAISQFIGPNRLQKLVPGIKVCLMNIRKDHRENAKSVRDGFHGLLLSCSDQDQVEATMRALLDGNNYYPYEIDVHKTPAGKHVKAMALDKIITSRQQEVVSLMSLGLSNKEIASHLEITESTVKRHLSNLFKTFSVNNRVEAIRVASKRGLLNT